LTKWLLICSWVLKFSTMFQVCLCLRPSRKNSWSEQFSILDLIWTQLRVKTHASCFWDNRTSLLEAMWEFLRRKNFRAVRTYPGDSDMLLEEESQLLHCHPSWTHTHSHLGITILYLHIQYFLKWWGRVLETVL
jgi:hypothetical protein